jgi:hypothetical protein
MRFRVQWERRVLPSYARSRHGVAACKLTGYPRRALNHFVDNNACSSSSCGLTVTFRLIPSSLCWQRTLRISWTTNFLSSARKVERSRENMSKSRLYDPFYSGPIRFDRTRSKREINLRVIYLKIKFLRNC